MDIPDNVNTKSCKYVIRWLNPNVEGKVGKDHFGVVITNTQK